MGRAAAHRFARQGARLVLAARSVASLEVVAEECRAAGADALVVPTDVSVEAEVVALAEAAVAHYGRIDVWVGAASVFSYGAFEDTPPEVFRQQLEANLMGQVASARAVLPVFRSQGAGVIVFVASIYSRVTSPYASGYITSKFGLLGFAESLGQELKGSGIAVCSVLPATIDTPIYQHAANYTGRRVHPLPPIVAPERVARAIVRVASSPRRSVVVGRSQAALIALHELVPAVYHRIVRPAMHLVAMRRGAVDPSPGNVFEPDPPSNAVTGGWRWPMPVRLAPFAVLAAVAGAALRRRR